MARRLYFSLVGIVVLVSSLLAGNLFAGNVPALGLDLQGGASVTLQPEGEFTPSALAQAVDIISQRVNALGVSEPEITRQGDNVVVNLPGVNDQQKALDIIGRQGELLLRPVLQAGTLNTDTSTTVAGSPTTILGSDTTIPATDGGPGSVRARGAATTVPVVVSTSTTVAVVAATETTLPNIGVSEDTTDPNVNAVLMGQNGEAFLVGPAGASGKVFTNNAQAVINNGSWTVTVELRSGADGADLWNALTTKCFNRDATCPTARIAIALDGIVISAPTVQEAIFAGGNVQISGDFSQTEARDLAKILEFGAVPVKFKVATVQTVSPTLGKDSLRAAIISGIVGVLLVMAFFFVYYRMLTIVVVAGLVVSSGLLWSIIALISRTNGLALTLSGVAGIIVSIGVTVDSYVVFFERIKDELHAGKSLRSSAQRSFQLAWRTILAADTVSFLGALTLWYLTVGSVRGFAFFLGLSTVCDVIIAYFFTRPAVLLLARSKFLLGRKILGVALPEESAR
ncbi:MAG: protein translocase subunit SecD [Actinobacteria bacterium]|nr:MAG: protein translocase subunit SecD [Actinomycetota bacterium]